MTRNFRTIVIGLGVASLMSGAAIAQTSTPQTNDRGNVPFQSTEEESMYRDNSEALRGFFTDDTMSTLRSEDEVRSTFTALGLETQGQIKKACETAASNRGSYGTVTTTLCTQLGTM